MEFINSSQLTADLYTGFVEEDVIEAQVCARATYRLNDDCSLALAAEPWPLFGEPLQTKHGAFPIDRRRRSPGCEVVVTGTVRLEKPVREAEVSLRIDNHRRTIRLIGDRVWREKDGELYPSEPAPFSEMPLAWSHAYGGAIEFEGQMGSHSLNGEGKGFYLSADEAVDGSLPNLEDPLDPIARWEDRPTPSCWASVRAPLSWYAAAEAPKLAGLTVSETLERLAERTRLSACRPDMVLSDVTHRSAVELVGLGSSTWSMSLRQAARLRASVHWGSDRADLPLELDGIWLFLDERLLVITSGTSIRLPYRPRESRTCELVAETT